MFVVAGESLIDLVAERQEGAALRFSAHPGGSPYNCALALARLGHPTGFLCPISSDSFGDLLVERHRDSGVTQLITARVREPTTLAVATLNEKKQAQYAFHRGADRAFTRDGLIAALPDDIEVFQFGGFASVIAADADTWLAVADAAAARGATITLDPNIRPSLIDSPAAYRDRLDRFFSRAHLIKLSDEDLAWLDPDKSIDAHAADLLAFPNCRLVVVTMGEEGSRGYTRSARSRASSFTMGPADDTRTGDTVGAGDTFMAGLIGELAHRGLLDPRKIAAMTDEEISSLLAVAAIAAGLNCLREGCDPPGRAEVDAILGR